MSGNEQSSLTDAAGRLADLWRDLDPDRHPRDALATPAALHELLSLLEDAADHAEHTLGRLVAVADRLADQHPTVDQAAAKLRGAAAATAHQAARLRDARVSLGHSPGVPELA